MISHDSNALIDHVMTVSQILVEVETMIDIRILEVEIVSCACIYRVART